MASKRGPKLLGKAVGAAANFVPGGAVAKAGLKLAGSAIGAIRGNRGVTRRKATFSITKLQKRLIRAKFNAKIKRIQLSAFKGL